MIVSRSADYALRAMIYLARSGGTRFITLNEIAMQMRTPPFLLARLMQRLVHGQLVASLKGHHGGFQLLLEPRQITAGRIVNLIDGPFVMFDCTGQSECGLKDACCVVDMFARAERALQEVFASVTLEQLAHASPAWRSSGSNRLSPGAPCASIDRDGTHGREGWYSRALTLTG
jgi:Rrf2 family protein